jgi:hypothetical protein
MKKRKHISKDTTLATVKTLIGESDRGCVILASATLEDTLRDMHDMFITMRLAGIPNRKKLLEDLQGPYGPLSTFSGKIKLAFAYGVITTDQFLGLEAMRTLRNEAAHANIAFSFNDLGVKKHIEGIGMHKSIKENSEFLNFFNEYDEIPLSKRQFILAFHGLDLALNRKGMDNYNNFHMS